MSVQSGDGGNLAKGWKLNMAGSVVLETWERPNVLYVQDIMTVYQERGLRKEKQTSKQTK